MTMLPNHLVKLQGRLQTVQQIAWENLKEAQECQKKMYDQKAEEREFTVSKRVLVLLPDQSSKFLAQ